jgi:hypothetical protein
MESLRICAQSDPHGASFIELNIMIRRIMKGRRAAKRFAESKLVRYNIQRLDSVLFFLRLHPAFSRFKPYADGG